MGLGECVLPACRPCLPTKLPHPLFNGAICVLETLLLSLTPLATKAEGRVGIPDSGWGWRGWTLVAGRVVVDARCDQKL